MDFDLVFFDFEHKQNWVFRFFIKTQICFGFEPLVSCFNQKIEKKRKGLNLNPPRAKLNLASGAKIHEFRVNYNLFIDVKSICENFEESLVIIKTLN